MNGKRYVDRVLREIIENRRAGVTSNDRAMEKVFELVSELPSPAKEETFVSLVLGELGFTDESDTISRAA